jgi:hypothetical protein
LQAEGDGFESRILHAVPKTVQQSARVLPMFDSIEAIESYQFAQEKCDKAAYELRIMLGNGCIDFRRILEILEQKVR